MRCKRYPETRIFGYAIERLEEYDETGLPRAPRFEVLCPKTGAVLAAFDDANSAKRFAIVHELRRHPSMPENARGVPRARLDRASP